MGPSTSSSPQPQHSHLVIQQLLSHLDANSRSAATVRAGIVEVLSEAAVIAATGSVGKGALKGAGLATPQGQRRALGRRPPSLARKRQGAVGRRRNRCSSWGRWEQRKPPAGSGPRLPRRRRAGKGERGAPALDLGSPPALRSGPTVLEMFNTLLRQLRLSIDYALTGSYDGAVSLGTKIIKEHEERMFQEAVIKTIGAGPGRGVARGVAREGVAPRGCGPGVGPQGGHRSSLDYFRSKAETGKLFLCPELR